MNCMNSGYHGYSMSNRAVEAYKNNEKPLSKWTKGELLDECESILDNIDVDYTICDLKKLRVSVLKSAVLGYSGWHHTSSYINSTDFYKVSKEKLAALTLEQIETLLSKKEEKKRPIEKKRDVNISYGLELANIQKQQFVSRTVL